LVGWRRQQISSRLHPTSRKRSLIGLRKIMRVPHSIVAVIALLLSLSSALAASQLRQIGMVSLPGSPGFGEVAFAGGMLVMTHPAASTVDVFNPARRRMVAQISGLQSPRGIAVDEQNRKVYVADAGNNSIAVISTDTWKLSDTVPLQASPDQLSLHDNGMQMYWSDAEAGTISLLDLRTRQNIGTVEVGGAPRYLASDPDRQLLFVTVQDKHEIVAIDPQLKISERFSLNASQPTGLVYDARFGELYVAVRFAVLAINAQNGTEVNRVPAAAGVDRLWLDPESRTLYAAGGGSLLTMHANGRLSAAEEIDTGVKGHTVAYDADKRLVLLPGGRESKSKILILRQMTPGQPADESAQAHVQ
jgi:YVTN family beta-propeller protein